MTDRVPERTGPTAVPFNTDGPGRGTSVQVPPRTRSKDERKEANEQEKTRRNDE